MIGRFVLIRCADAGVHTGFLKTWHGRCAHLDSGPDERPIGPDGTPEGTPPKECRRIWSWVGANTLHEVVENGVGEGSNISEPTTEVVLTEICEILFPSAQAEENLRRSRWHT